MNILNVAGGKIILDTSKMYDEDNFVVHLDIRFDGVPMDVIQTKFIEDEAGLYFSGENIYKFLEINNIPFDVVYCHRFLEHVPFDNVLNFIYQLSQNIVEGGQIEVIVPDYHKLAKLLITEKVGSKSWEAENIILTTELVNCPSDPHASIWTVDRLKYFFELENRFSLSHCETDYEYDGRDIYIKAVFTRITLLNKSRRNI